MEKPTPKNDEFTGNNGTHVEEDAGGGVGMCGGLWLLRCVCVGESVCNLLCVSVVFFACWYQRSYSTVPGIHVLLSYPWNVCVQCMDGLADR